ncbi:MAG TPA: formylglycine-generating enzyme family protein [Polyangiaceae bacterium]
MIGTGTTVSGSVWFLARRQSPPDDALSGARPSRDETSGQPLPRADISWSRALPEKARGGATPAPEATIEPPRHVLAWPEDGVEMAFRCIPAGTFRMGSHGYEPREEPAHVVRIPEPFWMAETPVTQAEFLLFTRASGIEHENHFGGRPQHPAESLDWRMALRYCAWLTRERAADFPEGFGLACLPTEAEWEYACRAGTDTEYYTGDGHVAFAEAGWFGSTHRVRQRAPNAFRLYDLHGNVWEWCHDVFDETAYRRRVDGAADPGASSRRQEHESGLESTLESGRRRVLRGGSWRARPEYCRSASRFGHDPDARMWFHGFRVCLVRGPADSRRAAERAAPGAGGRGTALIGKAPQAKGAGADQRAARRARADERWP